MNDRTSVTVACRQCENRMYSGVGGSRHVLMIYRGKSHVTLICGVSRGSARNQPSSGDQGNRAQPPRHTPADRMSFLRIAFRGPAASFARNRVSVSAVAIPRRTWLPQRAAFSAAAGLTKDEITTRVLDVLKGFEKVDPTKVCNTEANVIARDV